MPTRPTRAHKRKLARMSHAEHAATGQNDFFGEPASVADAAPRNSTENSEIETMSRTERTALGMPQRCTRYGEASPEPAVITYVGRKALAIADVKVFVIWLEAQEMPVHVDVTVRHVMRELSGLTTDHLRWLCQACRQAGRAPEPFKMKRAVVEQDVGLLRPGGWDPERTHVP